MEHRGNSSSADKSQTKTMSGNLIQLLSSLISPQDFQSWYQERQATQNVQQGKPYFNSPSPVPRPEKHSASRLLQCHRRTYYQLNHAPAETTSPDGVFWFGNQFEIEIAVPFLREIAPSGVYVQNSRWVDIEIPSEDGTLRFRGETDPVFVDDEGTPILLTEIKTSTSIGNLTKPRQRHRAQVHVYLYGLSQEFDFDIRDAVIIYVDRDNFTFKAFPIRFDTAFWKDSLITWAGKNTHFRRRDTLPPPVPEFEWECRYCPYRRRCGDARGPYSNIGITGLLPLGEDYPRDRLEEYLTAYPKAKLTPTLAHKYPELASEHGAYNWQCEVCSSEFAVDIISWDGKVDSPPVCTSCATDGVYAPLAGPHPDAQAVSIEED